MKIEKDQKTGPKYIYGKFQNRENTCLQLTGVKGNKPFYRAASRILGPLSKDSGNANWAIQSCRQTEVIHLFEKR